jgi:RNA polymerase sigma-70 factor (ECF subfamily)
MPSTRSGIARKQMARRARPNGVSFFRQRETGAVTGVTEQANPATTAAAAAPAAMTAPGGRAAAAIPGTGLDVEALLVRRSQAGDRAAFEQLVRQTARLVYARAFMETADRDRAEDVVQETFLLAWRRIGQVSEPAGFRAWLTTVTRSVAADMRRRESRKKRSGPRAAQHDDAAFDVPDGLPTPDQALERREERDRLLGMLRRLPDEYSLPITLRYIAGADYDTIGRQLGLSNGSLRGLLNRGMAKLRELMGAPDRRGD